MYEGHHIKVHTFLLNALFLAILQLLLILFDLLNHILQYSYNKMVASLAIDQSYMWISLQGYGWNGLMPDQKKTQPHAEHVHESKDGLWLK